jgi:hypothetical protein
MTCPSCGKPFENEHGLKIHLKRWCKVPAKRSSWNFTGEAGSERKMPPAEDRNNAERFANLPWITWPSTPQGCDSILDGIARAQEFNAPGHPFWASLRTYLEALRDRLGRPIDESMPQTMAANKNWKNVGQARLIGKVIA